MSHEKKDDKENIILRQIQSNLKRHVCEFGDDSLKVAETWNSLGLVRLHMQRDAQAARKCHTEALRIFRLLQVPVSTAITLNDLGYCYERLNERQRALDLYSEALEVLKRENMEKSHPRMIATQRSISRVMRQ